MAAIDKACFRARYLMPGEYPWWNRLIIAVVSSKTVSYAFLSITVSQMFNAGNPVFLTTILVAINSASEVELETQFCFLEHAASGKQLFGPAI